MQIAATLRTHPIAPEAPVNHYLKARFLLLPLIAVLMVNSPAQAESAYPTGDTAASEPFGGRAAMDVWVQDLNYYILGDNRINRIFAFDGDTARNHAFQNDVEDLVLSSPIEQARADTIAAKYKLLLTSTEYNAVIEDAYLACEASRTRYHTCNQIVAVLAPLERAIANQ